MPTKYPLLSNARIALIPANGLGDGLIQMTLAYHLAKTGYHVTFFHDFLNEMKSWFPTVDLQPISPSTSLIPSLRDFDHVIFLDHHKADEMASSLTHSFVLPKDSIDPKISMLENIVNLGKNIFDIEMTKENGMTIPPGLILRKYSKRILIHPTSTDAVKNWPAKNFLSLAKKLKQDNLEPIFILSPKEQLAWKGMINDTFEMPLFKTIDALARFVVESHFMIGNDSGIGHLASNLDLPTITIFSSKKRAMLWHPDWGKNQSITPCIKIPGKLFKNSWKYLISIHQVYHELLKLENDSMLT